MSLIADALRQAQQERETPGRRREDAAHRILAGRSGAVGPGSWLRAPRPELPRPLLVAIGLFTTATLGAGGLVARSLRSGSAPSGLVTQMTAPNPSVVTSMTEAGQVDSLARVARRATNTPPAMLGSVPSPVTRLPAATSARDRSDAAPSTASAPAEPPSPVPSADAAPPTRQAEAAATAQAIHLVLAPTHAQASELVRAGVAAQQKGDNAAAARLFTQALEQDPQNAEAANDLGIALQAQSDLSGARDAFRRAVTAQPRYATAWSNLGAVLSALGETDEAKTALAEAARLDPRNMGVKVNLAIVYQRQGLPEEAARILLEVLAVAPGMPEAHYTLAQVREQQGDRTAAVDEYRLFLSSSGGRFPAYERTVRQRLQRLEGAPDAR